MKKREKRPLSYKEAHNKALDRYKKSTRLLIWVGALNVVSLLISIIQFTAQKSELFFYFCFGINDVIFQAIGNIPGFFENHVVLYFIIAVIIALITTAGVVLLGVFASQGKKKALIGEIVFYTLDTLSIIACGFLGENYISMLLMTVFHVIILSLLFVAVYEYYKIIQIAKNYGVLKPKNESEGEANGSI